MRARTLPPLTDDEMQTARRIHAAAKRRGLDYTQRHRSLRHFSRLAWEIRMMGERPRRTDWEGEDSPIWIDWHRVRGIDVYGYRSRGYRLSEKQRRAVIERDGLVCGLCGNPVDDVTGLHIDHIVPRIHGGTDRLDNLQVAHPFCNISKGARI